jgi:2,4-dienoyl-CoA reductase-like NADH-dependent reductase (Old Yellow Enzyme family)
MPSLDTPITLRCGGTLGNRIVKAAMSERLADANHAPSDDLLRLYQRWAAGGAGLLISGHVMIDRAAMAESGNVVLDDLQGLAPFRRWATIAQENNTTLWLQLNHPGRQITRNMAKRSVAPSAIPMVSNRRIYAPPRALTEAEVKALVGLARPLAVDPHLPRRLLSDPAERTTEIRLTVGLKALDAVIEVLWYQWQLRRLARGKSPRPHACRFVALRMALRFRSPPPSQGRMPDARTRYGARLKRRSGATEVARPITSDSATHG